MEKMVMTWPVTTLCKRVIIAPTFRHTDCSTAGWTALGWQAWDEDSPSVLEDEGEAFQSCDAEDEDEDSVL